MSVCVIKRVRQGGTERKNEREKEREKKRERTEHSVTWRQGQKETGLVVVRLLDCTRKVVDVESRENEKKKKEKRALFFIKHFFTCRFSLQHPLIVTL